MRAVAELQRRGIDVACWLAGEERGGGDVFTGRLRTLIAELGVGDRVQLLGFARCRCPVASSRFLSVALDP